MISQSHVHSLRGSETHSFDLFINSLGYEERASCLLRAQKIEAASFISLSFGENAVLYFDANKKIMEGLSAHIVSDVSAFFRHEFQEHLDLLIRKFGRKLVVGIDVSSMNRTMAALSLSSMFACNNDIDSFEIFYVPAKFKEPNLLFSPIEQVGAVIPELSGFDSEPALPVALVLGLGYEYGTAVGLINQLEPNFTICFRAIGSDDNYDRAVRNANLDFDFNPYNVEVTEYELLDLKAAYDHIENIVHSLVGSYRVVMVPMGPKILSALLVLIALKYFGKVAVWRVARPSEPASVEPDDLYVTARVETANNLALKDLRLLTTMLQDDATAVLE
ncbi:hypothetical protein [Bradyrhizobium sp. th.b2]|uniref:hypothetical protein n=1 Tax=Bradyrhizobium sp. th-b2 TaxID=172088 RepID=UPI00048FA25C|nr:hypothetical protein [Bradyrhizobium sp. th.b2]